MSKKRTMSAATFKAECLAVLDRVAETREPVVVTKRGRPVAQVVPLTAKVRRPLRGSVRTRGDLVSPILGRWDVEA